ncbi:RBR-type E3 ubiquitin transferase [Caerostris extrusa]|uniref:RBR-type E3 ubiquitin transferase n=1 Tax=Caerostris extrusa TaxID=172846 RepID=A0AAV4UQF4_CAEEX|nr:RBR-type E3 ubiquitin transferase [Caerostris extrusa]
MTSSTLETGVTEAKQANLPMSTSVPQALLQEVTNLSFDTKTQNIHHDKSADKIISDAPDSDIQFDSRLKSVHFEDSQLAVAPPRKKKSKQETNESHVEENSISPPEETIAAESKCQTIGGLFKKDVHSQELQNFEISSTQEEQFSSEQLDSSAIISKDISIKDSNFESEQKIPFDDIKQPIPKLYDIIKEISGEELFETTPIIIESSSKFEVPKLSTLIQNQIIQESSKSEIISEDSVATFPISEHKQENFEDEQFGYIHFPDSEESPVSQEQDLSVSSEIKHEDNLGAESNFEYIKKSPDSTDYSSDIPEALFIPDVSLSNIKNEQSDKYLSTEETYPDFPSTSNIVSVEECQENKIVGESFHEKPVSDLPLLREGPEYDEDYIHYRRDSKLDEYSILQIDEEFEDGLRLVEETENLINEFCDIYPSECFSVSSNEIQNLNTKNNKHDSTYDSEYEWKLNEERHNSLNANFIENKAYKMDLDSAQSSNELKNELIINTVPPADDNSDVNKSIQEIRKSTSSLADISEISELVYEGEDNLVQSVEERDTIIENISNPVQSLSVLCKRASSVLESETSSEDVLYELTESNLHSLDSISDIENFNKETLDALNEASDDSLVASTHSSVSTQIAVFADTLLQDLTEELGVSLDSNITELSDEKSMPPDIPTSTTDEMEIITNYEIAETPTNLTMNVEIESETEEFVKNQHQKMEIDKDSFVAQDQAFEEGENLEQNADGNLDFIEAGEVEDLSKQEDIGQIEGGRESQNQDLDSSEQKDLKTDEIGNADLSVSELIQETEIQMTKVLEYISDLQISDAHEYPDIPESGMIKEIEKDTIIEKKKKKQNIYIYMILILNIP